MSTAMPRTGRTLAKGARRPSAPLHGAHRVISLSDALSPVDTASVRAERDGAATFDRLVEQRSSLLAGTDWSAVDDGVSETLQALLACMAADECSFFSSE